MTLAREAIALMESDHASALTLDDVARQIATSPRQLQRSLDEHADAQFRQCLAGIRMQRAAELLAETSIPLPATSPPASATASRRSSPRRSRGAHGVAPTRYRADRDGGFAAAA